MTAVSHSESAAPSPGPSPADRRISRRIAAISESATLAVDAKAKALKAAGKPVIGFGSGDPDFPTPDYIVEAAVAACRRRRSEPMRDTAQPVSTTTGTVSTSATIRIQPRADAVVSM